MEFAMWLEPPGPCEPPSAPENYFVLVIEACECLEEARYTFHMTGFGEEEWYVEVGYELSTVIEQLPAALDHLRAGLPSEIDLYSQGLQRTLTISPMGDEVEIRCVSRTSWQPDPDVVRMDAGKFETMLVDLAKAFAAAMTQVSPAFARVEPIASWAAGVV